MLALYLSMIETPEQQSLFELMYYELRDMLYAKAVSILRDEQLAEDAVHTAFVRVATNFSSIALKLADGRSIAEIKNLKNFTKSCPKFGGYMVIVVKNVCIDMLKQDRRKETTLTESDGFTDSLAYKDGVLQSAEDAYINNQTVEAIYEAIRRLDETYSETLYMHIVLGMDAREIAKEFSCSYEAVRKRIQRGRSELRRMLEEDGRI